MPAATTVWRTAAAVGVVPMLAQPAWEGNGLSQQGRGGLIQLQAVLFDDCRSRDFCMSAIHDDNVNQVHDLKGPLKGKGGALAQWRADAARRLAQIHRDMEVLAAASKSIEGRKWSLNVYRARGNWQVRWRMTNGQHATWASIDALLATLPPGLARWYRLTEDAAQLLNHREQAGRYEVNTVARLAGRQHGTSV